MGNLERGKPFVNFLLYKATFYYYNDITYVFRILWPERESL